MVCKSHVKYALLFHRTWHLNASRNTAEVQHTDSWMSDDKFVLNALYEKELRQRPWTLLRSPNIPYSQNTGDWMIWCVFMDIGDGQCTSSYELTHYFHKVQEAHEWNEKCNPLLFTTFWFLMIIFSIEKWKWMGNTFSESCMYGIHFTLVLVIFVFPLFLCSLTLTILLLQRWRCWVVLLCNTICGSIFNIYTTYLNFLSQVYYVCFIIFA